MCSPEESAARRWVGLRTSPPPPEFVVEIHDVDLWIDREDEQADGWRPEVFAEPGRTEMDVAGIAESKSLARTTPAAPPNLG